MFFFSICLLLFIIFKISQESCPAPRIPEIFKCEGTHYECFYKLSKHFPSEMSIVFSEDHMKGLLEWKEKHPKTYAAFESIISENYHEYFEEMRGIADGAGVDFSYVLLTNLENEIGRGCSVDSEKDYSSDHPKPINDIPFRFHYYDLQCTDIHVNFEDRHCIGHNEDGGTLYHNISFFVDFKLEGKDSNPPRFVAFVYPGILPGLAFGFNENGFTFSNNALFTETCRVGIPKTIVNRDALSATSWDDLFEKTISVPNRSAGQSLNVGNINDHRQLLIELATYNAGSLEIVGNYSHMNNYRLINFEFVHDGSSKYRLWRAWEFPAPHSPDDIKKMLGDTAGYKTEKCPMYNWMTMATCIYDLDEKTAQVYVCSNPKSASPQLTFDLVLK